MARLISILGFLAAINQGCLGFPVNLGRDCTDILAIYSTVGFAPPSGKYNLLVGEGRRSLWAYCDMNTDGGGWTVIQRRSGSLINFYRNWLEYENGFGTPEDDHWIGNTYIHSMTINKRYTLRIEFTDWLNKMFYAEYEDFRVGGAGCNYTLEKLGHFCGSCGDSLTPQLRAQFSTFDRDNDANSGSCAITSRGAWWYNSCHQSNLNGAYKSGGLQTTDGDGINWSTCGGYKYSYKTTRMMIRPYNF